MSSKALEGFSSKLSPHEGAVGSQLPHGPCNCTWQGVSCFPWESQGWSSQRKRNWSSYDPGWGKGRKTCGPSGNKGFMVLVEDIVLGSTLSVLAETDREELHCPSTATVT